jgi:hypothetical protein
LISAAGVRGYTDDISVWGDSYASLPAHRLVAFRKERLKAARTDPSIILKKLSLAIDVLLPVWLIMMTGTAREIENERVGIPAPDRADQVSGYPDEQDHALDDNDGPRYLDRGASAILCPRQARRRGASMP